MSKILLIVLLSLYCYGDYVAFDVKRGWNVFASTYGIKNISTVDPDCVSHYSILSPYGKFNTYQTGVKAPPSTILDRGVGFMFYSPFGKCTINLSTLDHISNIKNEKFYFLKGWNLRGSSYRMSNLADINGSCVSEVAVLRQDRFIKYKIKEINASDTKTSRLVSQSSALPTSGTPSSNKSSSLSSSTPIYVPSNTGVLFKAKSFCFVDVKIQTSGSTSVHRSSFTKLAAPDVLQVKHPIENIFKNFNDTRDYFKSNCITCHSLNDTRLHKTALQLENNLLPYRYGYKKTSMPMVNYIAPLSNSDFRMFTKYIEVLYKYLNDETGDAN